MKIKIRRQNYRRIHVAVWTQQWIRDKQKQKQKQRKCVLEIATVALCTSTTATTTTAATTITITTMTTRKNWYSQKSNPNINRVVRKVYFRNFMHKHSICWYSILHELICAQTVWTKNSNVWCCCLLSVTIQRKNGIKKTNCCLFDYQNTHPIWRRIKSKKCQWLVKVEHAFLIHC